MNLGGVEQVGNAITFRAFFVKSKEGETGLTVTVDVYRNDAIIVTAASAVEVAGGVYKYQLAAGSVNAEGVYVAIFKTADVSVDQQDLPDTWIASNWPLDGAVPAAYAVGSAGWALGRVGRGNIEVTSPVAEDGGLTLVRHDDYLSDDGRGVIFTSTGWTDLTLVEDVRLTLRARSSTGAVGATLFTLLHDDDLIVAGPSGSQSVTFSIPGADTLLLTPGVGTAVYDVQARFGANPQYTRATLALGTVTVLGDVTRATDEPV